MSFCVYYINKFDTFGNNHSISRDETWKFQLDIIFNTLFEAKNYIIKKNKQFCTIDLNLNQLSTESEIRNRCLGLDENYKDFISYRRWFLCNNTLTKQKIIKEIREHLKKRNINNIINN